MLYMVMIGKMVFKNHMAMFKKWGKTNRNSLYVGISSTKLIELHKSLGVTPYTKKSIKKIIKF